MTTKVLLVLGLLSTPNVHFCDGHMQAEKAFIHVERQWWVVWTACQ